MSAILDTNVLIFDTFEDSQFHREASSALDSIDGWGLPSIVLHELVWFFKARKLELSRTRTKVEEYLANQKTSFVPVTTDDIRFAITRTKSHGRYNDFVILATSRRLGLPLLTFDQELMKEAKANSVDLLKLWSSPRPTKSSP